MAKYFCKVLELEDMEASSILYIETAKYPYEVAKFLSDNVGKQINKMYIPHLFEIPDFYQMDCCEMHSSESVFRLRFTECEVDKEITIENIGREYINIDIEN